MALSYLKFDIKQGWFRSPMVKFPMLRECLVFHRKFLFYFKQVKSNLWKQKILRSLLSNSKYPQRASRNIFTEVIFYQSNETMNYVGRIKLMARLLIMETYIF